MLIKKNALVVGTDGTELKVLSHVAKDGKAVVRVLEAGNLLEVRKHEVIKDFDVYHGCVKFTEVKAV